jgi:ABC-2 type transport system ATP-binding protein
MRQKVGIAIALAKQADALLLDEPTSGLDPQASNEFSNLLKRMSANNVAILMATHDLFRTKDVGTRIGIMDRGRLTEIVNPDSISHGELERIYLEHLADAAGQTVGASKSVAAAS